MWAELKDKVKHRKPKTIEDLKKFCIEEWNKIEPKKYFKHFEEKIKLCKEIKRKGLMNIFKRNKEKRVKN